MAPAALSSVTLEFGVCSSSTQRKWGAWLQALTLGLDLEHKISLVHFTVPERKGHAQEMIVAQLKRLTLVLSQVT